MAGGDVQETPGVRDPAPNTSLVSKFPLGIGDSYQITTLDRSVSTSFIYWLRFSSYRIQEFELFTKY